MITTVLFDLDGTLADTAPDMAYALNQVLLENNHPQIPFEEIRPIVSHGGAALIQHGFQIPPEHDQFEYYRQRFLEIYQDNIQQHTQLFEGMEQVLQTLEQQNKTWGVVTNKPSWLTDPLIAALGLTQRAACVVSGDTTNERKPHPEPMFYACRQTSSLPEECLYIGDAERDIEAGYSAGMQTLVALFGYIGREDEPHAWGADGLIETPLEILDWI